jgi:3'-5' exoribonuclease
MKTPFVRDLIANEVATGVFLVQSREVRQKRTGESYLSLILADRTGELEAKMWDNVAEVVDSFDRDDFIKVRGLLQVYNNRPQFVIHKLRPVPEKDVDLTDFLPCSERDPQQMWAELRGIVSTLDNVHIRALLDAFLDDPEIAVRYKTAPAAKTIHHAFRSGLLEHVLSLCTLAKLVTPHYPGIDLNLMIAGAVLHDIGKIYELSFDRTVSYSAEGHLVGHIAIGIRMLSEKLRAFPQFPVAMRHLIEHIILSHHGQLDFGSPKVPVFPEAMLMHFLDDMDSKMEAMRALLAKDPQATGLVTPWNNSLERALLRKNIYLAPPAAAPAPADRTAPVSSMPPPAALGEFGSRLREALSLETLSGEEPN